MTDQNPGGGSWAPQDMVEGGGGGYSGLCEIVGGMFAIRAVADYRREPVEGEKRCVLYIMTPEHQLDNGDLGGKQEMYSIGNGYVLGMMDEDSGKVVPVPDGVFEGEYFIGPSLKKNSNFGIFVENLFNAGYNGPAGPGVPISSLNGTMLEVGQIDQIDFNTKQPKINKGGFKETITVPVKLVDSLPWKEAAPKKGATAAKPAIQKAGAAKPAVVPAKAGAVAKPAPAKAAAASAPAAAEGDEGQTLGVIADILSNNGGTVAKGKMFSETYKAVTRSFPELEPSKAQLVKDVNALVTRNENPEIFTFDPSTGMVSAS
jgi:hypothetical protein